MGGASSKDIHSANDFELVIRSAKELEHTLKTQFNATGNGVNEMLDSLHAREANSVLPLPLVKRMRHLIWVRNQLVHEYGVNAIPGDRSRFISDFELSVKELNEIIARRDGGKTKGGSCVIC